MQTAENRYGVGTTEFGNPLPKILGCPPGLEYLSVLTELQVDQKKECLEIFTGWEQRNRYELRNGAGQMFFYAQEESSCFQRQCCGPNRRFLIHITNSEGHEVLRFRREFRCCVGCCWFSDSCNCAFRVFVETPNGEPVGQIVQGQSCWKPEFKVLDYQGEHTLHIQGPCCVCDCCTEFEIQTKDQSSTIGLIRKRWGGLAKEMFTNADTFNLTFPEDLDVKAKATLIGAAFLIDFMFYQNQNN